MKKTVAFVFLFASQITFSASSLECDFAIVKNGDVQTIKKSLKLKKINSGILIGGVELKDNVASLEFEDSGLNYKISVSASVSKLGKKIKAEIRDSKLISLQRISGETSLKAEIVRGSEFGIDAQTEGAAVVCSLI